MKITKLFFAFAAFTLTLSACGTATTTDPSTNQHKLTYKIVRTSDNQQLTTATIKQELEQRLLALGSTKSTVTNDGDTLVVDTDLPDFNRSKALDLATPKQVTLQESRTTFTPAEAEANKQYNQYQKDTVTNAHADAITHPETMDTLVVKASDEIDLVTRGEHGPFDQTTINEPKVWEALLQTPVNSITPVVELSYVIWFAKVTDVQDEGGSKIFHYQQVSRDLKEEGPYLNYMPILNLSGHITKVTVVKKDPEDVNNIKDFTVHATLDADGQKMLAQISKDKLNKPLRLFIDDMPFTTITFKQSWTGTDLVLDNDYTDINTKDIADRLNQNSLSARLTLIGQE